MRCWIGLLGVLNALVSPMGVSAQAELDASINSAAPSPSVDDKAARDMRLRVKRAKIGLGASAASLVIGGIFVGVSIPNLSCEEPAMAGGAGGDCPSPGWAMPMFVTGVTLAGGGVLGMISTGILLGVRKRKLRRLGEVHYAPSRRAQWDAGRSRLVF